MTSNCRKYALISMCYIKFPTCRQPDQMNAKYFGQLARIIHQNFRLKYFRQTVKNSQAKSSDELDGTDLFRKDNFNMLCREDCFVLENVLCEKEFAIGKRHPIIGALFLNFKSCTDLLGDDEARAENETTTTTTITPTSVNEQSGSCLSIGVNKTDGRRDMGSTCYWGDGGNYRGAVNRTISGRTCEYWTKTPTPFKDIQQYPELIGNNYCRSVGIC